MLVSPPAKAIAMPSALFRKADSALREELRRPARPVRRELPILFVLTIPSVVTQHAGEDPARRALQWSDAFARAAADFLTALDRTGARNVVQHWINSSVSAVVPRTSLDRLAERKDVGQLILVVERNIML